jgi:hypothetical protein
MSEFENQEIQSGPLILPDEHWPQLQTCENAETRDKGCTCRCRGLYHGRKRGDVRDLPEGDPHGSKWYNRA